MNNTSADDRPKALLNGVLVGAIMFLSVLPALGWVWHRVLPEHTHVYIGAVHSDAAEIVPSQLEPDDLDLCLNCKGTQIRSGLVHLIDPNALQVLGFVGILGALFFGYFHPAFPESISISPYLYRSPILLRPDPPPNSSGIAA